MKLSALILAGGQSRRMGRDKAFLDWDGRPLLAWQLERVRPLQPEQLFISGRPGVDYGTFGCAVLHDAFPGCGPLAGIERGLEAMDTPLLLVLAVDMPGMTTGFLKRLLGDCTATVGRVPRRNGQPESLAAIYPKASHRVALALLTDGFYAAAYFAETCAEAGLVQFGEVSPGAQACLANWNRPEERALMPMGRPKTRAGGPT